MGKRKEGIQMVSFALTAEEIERLNELGAGNRTAGIRKLLAGATAHETVHAEPAPCPETPPCPGLELSGLSRRQIMAELIPALRRRAKELDWHSLLIQV